MISSLQLGWTHRDPCTASWYRDRLTYCHSSFALFFPGWLQRSLCFVHWTVTVHSAQLHVYAWTAEADRWFFSHFCIHKAPGEVSFTYKLCKTRTQGLLAPGGQDSDHVKPPCLLSVILTSPTSCIWLPACDCCCGILVVSERKEVETHADYRSPSFFGVEVARMCVCVCVCVCLSARRSGWKARRSGVAFNPSGSWNRWLNFIFKASLKELVYQMRHTGGRQDELMCLLLSMCRDSFEIGFDRNDCCLINPQHCFKTYCSSQAINQRPVPTRKWHSEVNCKRSLTG